MQIGMIGLGKMGGNMVTRLLRNGHHVVAYDRSADAVDRSAGEGAAGARTLEELVAELTELPRAVWVMVPAGDPTSSTIRRLSELCQPGDIVIDGGNTNWRDALLDAEVLKRAGLNYLDAGTSGGIWGLKNGYCLMVGGENEPVKRLEPIFLSLAPADGYAHVGAAGAGHFTKMVHNGIEYGLIEAYAEGFEVLQKSEFDLDLREIAGIWRYGSVVRSWLLDLLYDALERDGGKLEKIRGYVEDSGEGRWTVNAAVEEGVPADVLSASLFARFRSRQDHTFGEKVLSAMRQKFGGHVEQKSG